MDTNRILIVDDEADFRKSLVEGLEDMGYSPEGAATAEIACRNRSRRARWM